MRFAASFYQHSCPPVWKPSFVYLTSTVIGLPTSTRLLSLFPSPTFISATGSFCLLLIISMPGLRCFGLDSHSGHVVTSLVKVFQTSISAGRLPISYKFNWEKVKNQPKNSEVVNFYWSVDSSKVQRRCRFLKA